MKAVYFGGDITNPTLILRVTSFRAAGLDVASFTFRRKKFNLAFRPDWPNYDLGYTTDRKYRFRLLAIFLACRIIMRNRAVFENTDFLYARMIDMALLAQFARWWHKLDAKLIYEVEDVQAIFFKKTIIGGIFRWAERWLLSRQQLLVVMSPGFIRGYFAPIQKFDGPYFVLENKLQLPRPLAPLTPAADQWKQIRDKWVIGWNGTLRCERSMQILAEIATELGDRVEIRTHGFPTETGLPKYLEFISKYPNWKYLGEYKIPDDLEEMYGRVHFSWCLDFLDADGNSKLLLACRMYQGGYYGAVPLVASDSEMENFLVRHGIGQVFTEPYAKSVSAFLKSLTWDDYRAQREKVLGLGPSLFLDDGSDLRNLINAIQAAPDAKSNGARQTKLPTATVFHRNEKRNV
jgi:succinoglycan biosynthesis protein ExoL